MATIAKFSTQEIFSRVGSGHKVKVGDHVLDLSTKKLRIFKKSPKCVKCGAEGEIFVLQNFGGNLTLNLYTRINGHNCMLTLDHIIPKSKGGISTYENLQPMCRYCNAKKSDTFDFSELNIPVETLSKCVKEENRDLLFQLNGD